MLMLATVLASAAADDTARAPAPLAEAPAPAEWTERYRRGTTVATVGLGLAPAGVVIATVGLVTAVNGGFSDDEATFNRGAGVFLIGWLALQTAPPLMAGGSLSAARVLNKADRPVGRALGYVTWGLWGTQLVAVFATDVPFLGVGLYLGSLGTGIGQMVANTHAYRGERFADLDVPRRTFQWTLAPIATNDTRELAIVGTF
jgi:hypothetical protein